MDETVIAFPCAAFPEEGRVQRLLGIYGMRQEGLFMQRVKAPGGRVSAAQFRRLADLAEEHTPGYPLHLTTRQDVELHGLKAEQIVPVQQALHEVGLSTQRACGDTLRNIVCCPDSGLCAEGVDILPLAEALIAACEALPFLHALPRKFKISLSGCGRSCARPFLQDVGLVSLGGNRFRAVVAGSLGPRPGTGIEYPRTLKLEEVAPFVLGAIRLFNEEADRKVRGRARLRHVRERLGDEAFLARLDAAFQEEWTRASAPFPPLPFPGEGRSVRARLHFPLGDISPAEALALAKAAEQADAVLRIGLDHDLYLYGYRPVDLPPALAALADGPTVVACPGNAWCSRGVADSRAAAREVAVSLRGQGKDLRVCLSGCPNNCAQSAVADIGLIGCVKTLDGVRTECFRLLVGGGNGQTAALGREVHAALPAGRVAAVVAALGREGSGSASVDDLVAAAKRLAEG